MSADRRTDSVNIDPVACGGCRRPLTGGAARPVERRQVVDLPPVAAPVVTEYRLGARTCQCCGVTTTADWTDNADINTDVLATPATLTVRIGPAALAMCAHLTCAHYLGQLWATTMAGALTAAHHAATAARNAGHDRLDERTLAKGRTDNCGYHSEPARSARTLLRRFHR